MSEPTVFIVRVWRDTPTFRATARAVNDDQTLVFSEVTGLLHFLQIDERTVAAAKTVDRAKAAAPTDTKRKRKP